MTCIEVIDLYKEAIPIIFTKANEGNGFLDWILSYIDSVISHPLTPYTQENLKDLVEKQFEGTMTYDAKHNGCLAGGVARQFKQNGENPDTLEIFDSAYDPPQKVSEILLASSDAPLYFEVPCEIGKRGPFIDGGVGGNLMLKQPEMSYFPFQMGVVVV